MGVPRIPLQESQLSKKRAGYFRPTCPVSWWREDDIHMHYCDNEPGHAGLCRCECGVRVEAEVSR